MNRSLLKSPTPWIATGMGLVIGLVCVLLKGDERMSQWLFTSYEAQGFPSLEKVPVAGVFWSPMVNFISILWAGIAAMVHASSLDRVEAHHRAEAEKKVVTMRTPRSPSNS